MRRTYPDSRLEIWDTLYLNNISLRQEKDRNVDVVQVEVGSGEGSYIVEIVEKAEQEKTSGIGNKEQKYPI